MVVFPCALAPLPSLGVMGNYGGAQGGRRLPLLDSSHAYKR